MFKFNLFCPLVVGEVRQPLADPLLLPALPAHRDPGHLRRDLHPEQPARKLRSTAWPGSSGPPGHLHGAAFRGPAMLLLLRPGSAAAVRRSRRSRADHHVATGTCGIVCRLPGQHRLGSRGPRCSREVDARRQVQGKVAREGKSLEACMGFLSLEYP